VAAAQPVEDVGRPIAVDRKEVVRMSQPVDPGQLDALQRQLDVLGREGDRRKDDTGRALARLEDQLWRLDWQMSREALNHALVHIALAFALVYATALVVVIVLSHHA